MMLRLFDTYARDLRDFEPMDPAAVRMYCCGPTVYNYAHIGNLRTYVFEDVLRRVLEFNGHRVKHVMNITDVGHLVSDADTGEDKMEIGSRRTGKSAREIAVDYANAFKNDMSQLNILEPTIWCKATEHIPEQIEMIRCIEAKGLTYRTSDGIYFDTSGVSNYGHFARLDTRGLQSGARVQRGEKQHITDFALWKFSPVDQRRQMEWESPWGVGFPGWHIECSAMSVKYLGPFFDIHCGGEDHVPVHHTNEIAQTEACHGTRLANFWMHGHFLLREDAKMAKSTGEFLSMQSLIDRGYDPLAYRYFCMGAHYRAKLSFRWEALDGAQTALQRLRNVAYEWGSPGDADLISLNAFKDHINNDLNMPRALAQVWDLAKSDLPAPIKKATLIQFDRVLGLRLTEWQPAESGVPDQINALVDQRQRARTEKRWRDADELRKQIREAGYEIEDTPDRPRVRPLGRLDQTENH
jgi:cysteinyl-tRNA synthetase